MINQIVNPTLFEKGQSEDHRGYVEYYNSIDLSDFKRFYIVTNPLRGTVRAWHGHKVEAKLIKVLKGEFIVAVVKVDNWENPSSDNKIEKFKLNVDSGTLYIPPGYANGAINLVTDSEVIYFSSLKIDDSKNDDFRFDAKFWNPWSDYSPEIYE